MHSVASFGGRRTVVQTMESAVCPVLMVLMLVGIQSTFAAKVLYVRTHVASSVAEDSVQALGYKALFDSLGHPTTLIRTDGILGISLAQYDVIAISNGTGGFQGWAGDSATSAALKKSGKAILALGNGGPAFLQTLGLWCSWGQSAGSLTSGLVVTNPGHSIFTTPNAITIPPDKNLLLVTNNPEGQALFMGGGSPADVVVFGTAIGAAAYAPLALEKNRYFYWGLSAPAGSLTASGKRLIGNVLSFLLTITSVSGEGSLVASHGPERFSLQQNYPNPFNPSTTITFELPMTSHVSLAVYDILGREVSVLVNERRDTGVHEMKFDGSNLASGVYFYRLQAGDFVETKRLLLLR